MQVRQDLNVGGRFGRTQYQYTLQDQDINELNSWAPRVLAKLQKLPQLADVTSDQQISSGKIAMIVDRDQAARFGIQPALIDQTLEDAFGQSDVGQYFTQVNSYFIVLEVTPALQADPNTLQKLYIKSPITGSMVPLSTFVHYDTDHVGPLSINHQGQFPAVTISFNLPAGGALGGCGGCNPAYGERHGHAAHGHGHLSGQRAGISGLTQDDAVPGSSRRWWSCTSFSACCTRATFTRSRFSRRCRRRASVRC